MNMNVSKLKNRIDRIADLISLKLVEYKLKTIADIRHMSFELRTEIWTKFIKRSDPRIARFQRDLQVQFKRQFAEVIANVKKNPPKEQVIIEESINQKAPLTPEQTRFINLWMFDRKKWEREFMKTGKPHIQGAIVDGGEDALAKLGLAQEFATDEVVLDFVKKHSLEYAKEITGTTLDALRGQFVVALQNGEGVTKVMDRIQSVMTNCTEYRARMIAQTEMIGAINKGSVEAAKQSGVIWGHQWVGALDERIREDHEWLTVEGIAVPLGETFPRVNLEFPGEAGGDPAQVCNCRCTVKQLREPPEGE